MITLNRERSAAARWYPGSRRVLTIVFLCQILLAATNATVGVSSAPSRGRILTWAGIGVANGLGLWLVRRQRVEADEHGLTKVDVRTRRWPWAEVAAVRPDAAPPWGQWLVVETTKGDITRLGLEARETGPVEFWRRAAAHDGEGVDRPLRPGGPDRPRP